MNIIYETAKQLYPEASDEALDEIIWLTPWPCASNQIVVARLEEFREKHGANIGDAIAAEMNAFDLEFALYKQKHPEDFK